MRSDPHSPLAPARVRVLVLPLGRIRRSRFLKFYGQLTRYNAVALSDLPEESESISNGSRHNSKRLGMIVYDYSLSTIPEAHNGLLPFEIFRESLVVIGIGDASEYQSTVEFSNGEVVDWRRKQFLDLANSLHEQYPRALIQRVLLFSEPEIAEEETINDEFVLLPDSEDGLQSGLPRMVHNMTIALRREVYNYSKSIQSLPSIASPSLPEFQPPQPAWHSLDSPTMERRDSTFSQASTTSTNVDNTNMHRMSMPIIPSTNSSDITLRSESPIGKRIPAKTFDEITGSEPTALSNNPLDRLRARPTTMIATRNGSHDTMSVQGFGSDSFSEKTRHQGLGRIGVVNSGLLLLSGRWDDALQEGINCAAKARSFSDHIWYAKALEHIAISMVLLAWSGMEFQIPPICYTTTDQTVTGKAPPSPKPEQRYDLVLQSSSTPQAKATFMKMITSVMPGMTNMIQGIYGRPNSSGQGGAIPQFVLSETAIRMSKLLTLMNQSGGTLTDDDVAYSMLGTPRDAAPNNSVSRLRMHPSRRDITNFLSRALPDMYDNSALMPSDHAIVLAGVSAVYSLLGMQRKRGMMMKELLSVLLPILQQAKMAGAAEAGIHPSASVSALALAADETGWEVDTGIGSYLNAVCQAYDIPVADWSKQVGDELLQNQDGEADESTSISNQLIGNFVLHSQGGLSVKAEILRVCIQMCEALSDAAGVMHYSAALLRTAGPGVAPAAGAVDALVTLAREEQIQLANIIFKTAETGRSDDYPQPEVDYWDEFIVRGFYLLQPEGGFGMQLHKKSELKKVQTGANRPRDPFLHNPFLDKPKAASGESMLCANELNEFVVLLQNPFEFEVHVESLKLVADAVKLDVQKTDFVLKPCRTQSFSLSGSVDVEGPFNVTACIIKVKGCRKRRFPIFTEPWTPEADMKIKNLGFCSEARTQARDSGFSQRFSWNESLASSFPVPTSVALKVIPEQPILSIKSCSAPQNSLMLLEGERTTIMVTIRNESSVSADFLLVSFGDTATEAMQEAIGQKGIHPADMYEIEYQMSRLPVITMAPNQSSSIPAKSNAVFTFEVFAKAGLSSAYLQFDYAYLPSATTDAETFYTKKLRFTLDVTVNASVLLHRLEIVSLPGDFVGQLAALAEHADQVDSKHAPDFLRQISSALSESDDKEDYCLMLLDLRNSWPSPLNIDLRYSKGSKQSQGSADTNGVATFSSTAQIQPGQIVRQMLLIPKIYLKNPHSRIKPLSPAHQRQFIVSTDKMSPEIELRSRECFWFREALLQHITGAWTLPDAFAQRSGAIDLRAIRLSSRMLEHLRINDLKFEITASGDKIEQLTKTTFQATVDTFFHVKTTLKNNSTQIIYPLLRLRPSLAYQTREVALDLGKRFAWSGVLQQPLAPLPPHTEASVDIPVRALALGEYVMNASVEEIVVAESSADDSGGGDGANEKAEQKQSGQNSDDADLDDFVPEVGRRTWVAHVPCLIRIKDDD